MIGPLVGSFLIDVQWSTPAIVLPGALPMLVATLACTSMGITMRRRAAAPAGASAYPRHGG